MQGVSRWLAMAGLFSTFAATVLAQACPMCATDDSILNETNGFPVHIPVSVKLSYAKNTPQDFRTALNTLTSRCSTDSNLCNDTDISTKSINHLRTYDCQWNYTSEYNPQRYPAYILHAKCLTPTNYDCWPIYYPVPVLKTSGCNQLAGGEWHLEFESVAVGCTKLSPD